MPTIRSQPRSATVDVATGVRLHYMEQGDPNGEVIVFVHGWPDSWYSFSRVLHHLPERYHAYALDLRGFGRSDRPADGYTIDDLAADVVAFLDAVDVDRATLVGHSMGTFVARRAAQMAPDRTVALVLIGSAESTTNAVMREVRALLTELPDPVPVDFAREFQAGTVHVRLPDAFFDGIVAESAAIPARVWRRTFDGILAFDDRSELARIGAPTLVIWGEHDGLFDREQQERLTRRIPGARLRVYPDAGHCPNWEQPRRVADDVVAFLGSATRS
ncbi:alpha/beta hydrolase [Pseudonocardia aurantiaca]|uniref:Alpha/beta fold hydrolase n=1 Tax=Pseudonocardia aurantiaca TaxID=75290 RepID=A0ABW4FQK5_9PSEU